MLKTPRISTLATWAFISVVAWSCANIGRPSGGEKDSAGPEVIGTVPFPGTLNFATDEIVFYFDEFLKPGSYKDEIFISPVPPSDPEITVRNKTLKIKFMSPLRDSTTYVVTLGTGIKDFNEGNKMGKSYTYAFSTGSVLDSMRFSGHVTDMWTGDGQGEMKVVLFRPSEIDSHNIVGKRPDYVCVTDKEGNYDFQFLAPGRYLVYAFEDKDNDFKYTSTKDKIAIAPDPIVVLDPEDSVPPRVNLIAFRQDLEGPKVKSAKWANDYTIHIEFAEQIRPDFKGDSLRIELSDTVHDEGMAVVTSRFRHLDRRHLYIHSPLPRTADLDVHIVNLMDSLGHRGDTVVRVAKESQVREERNKWLDTPINLPRMSDFMVPAFFRLPESVDSAVVQLHDSAKKYVPVNFQVVGFHLLGRPAELLDDGQTYTLEVRKSLLRPDGKPIDTLLKVKLKFPDPDNFGTISGRVLPDSTKPGTEFMAIFRGAPGTAFLVEPGADNKAKAAPNKGGGDAGGGVSTAFEQRFKAPAEFKFVFLKAGKYSMDIIVDTDGNGVLTPGSMWPYKLPEKVYHQDGKFSVREKWDYKDVEVYPIPPVGGSKSKGGEGEEKGEDSDEEPKEGPGKGNPAGNPKGGNPKGGK
ncbi:MAG: Ig-like domain-containing protein [Bacteroidia bacterium]